jgi:hypothetical protein
MSDFTTEKKDKLRVEEVPSGQGKYPVDVKHAIDPNTPTLSTPDLDETSPATDRPAHFDEHGNFVERPPAELRKLMWRIDFRVIPCVAILTWLGSLDVSLGRAKLFGLESDLHMTGLDYNNLALMSTIISLIFHLPSNLIVTRIRPSLWFPGMCQSMFH